MNDLDSKLREILANTQIPYSDATIAQIKQCFIECGWEEKDGNS